MAMRRMKKSKQRLEGEHSRKEGKMAYAKSIFKICELKKSLEYPMN